MYNRMFIAFILILSFGVSGLAKESEIKLETVYEKTFEDTIVDVIFDTVTVSLEEAMKMGWKEESFGEEERASRRVKITFPKVIIVGDKGYPSRQKMKFIDKDGKVLKEVSGEGASRILISNNGDYILKALWYDRDKDEGGGGILYNSDGEVIWEKGEGAFYAITDNGYTGTGFISPDGSRYPFRIYTPGGEEIKEILLPEWKIFDAGMNVSGTCFIISYRGKAGFDSTGVMRINDNGRNVLNFVLSGDILPWNVVVVPEGTLVVSRGRNLTFIGNDKNIKWQKTLSVFVGGKPLSINIHSEPYFYFSEYGHLLKSDISNGEIQSHLNLKEPMKFFEGVFHKIESKKITGFKKQGR